VLLDPGNKHQHPWILVTKCCRDNKLKGAVWELTSVVGSVADDGAAHEHRGHDEQCDLQEHEETAGERGHDSAGSWGGCPDLL
jgi:hypothetical protein